ncbi:MAG: hypothetical protein BAA01_12835 [Bacillus thermozeamaize]|uniref:DUF4064 domain-containing protein n=1 Tax=Bacillus thermozeamaize TaxID=230954 RepID=A0A1Y3PPB9_9BACI|nr:MAG: hypothetical protein BAA01_12835 [Bacillus thermozeamaize]
MDIVNLYFFSQKTNPNRFGFALTSFILGLLGILLLLVLFITVGSIQSETDSAYAAVGMIAILSLIVNIIGIIFGALSFKTSNGKGFAIAGFVLSLVPFVSILILMIVGLMAE